MSGTINPWLNKAFIGHKEIIRQLNQLKNSKSINNTLIFNGPIGVGKCTLAFRYCNYIFANTDIAFIDYEQKNDNIFSQVSNHSFPNLYYISKNDEYGNSREIKIEDIRNLKKKILQSIISKRDRFIIFDDIELFNQNSLNALLKLIEEPSQKNYFFLINNKSKPLIETVKSRALEIKIILEEEQRLEIIEKLVNVYKLDLILDPETSQLSPGNFIKFNFICKEHDIYPTNDFVKNLSLLLNIYKKEKNILFINLIFYLADQYFRHIKDKDLLKSDQIFEIKDYIMSNLNSFMLYNINQNSLINAVNEKLNHE